MTGEALLPDTQAIIEQLEALSGYPVSCVADPAIGTLATISAATPDRPIHLIRYRPGVVSRDYQIAVEAGYAIRLFAMRPEDRFQLRARPGCREQVIKEFKRLNRELDDKLGREVGGQLFDGLMLQLRSCPIGILLDLWLYRDYPGLRPQQRQNLETQCQGNVNCLSGKYDREFPERIVQGNRAMNAAYALFAADLLQQPQLAIPYRAAGLESVGMALLQHITGQPLEAIDDRQLIVAWAEQLNVADWLDWAPLG